MFNDIQEITSLKAYPQSPQSYLTKSPKDLTVSQELLNEIVDAMGYDLKEIAVKSNIPLKTLYRVKSGVTKEPRPTTFRKIFMLYCQVCH